MMGTSFLSGPAVIEQGASILNCKRVGIRDTFRHFQHFQLLATASSYQITISDKCFSCSPYRILVVT